MKTTASVPKNYLYHGLYALILLFLCLPTLAQDKEFAVLHKNGKPYRIGKFVNSFCGKVMQITTFDENGDLIRQEEKQNKKYCGTTKVYDNKALVKEVKFKDNLMVSYISYHKGQVYTQVSEDRNVIIHQGKRLNLRMGKIYQEIGAGRIVVMTKNQFIDAARYILMPEKITEVLAGMVKDFNDKNLPDGSGYASCGGKTDGVKDAGKDLANSASTDPQKKKDADDLNAEVGSTCAANVREGLTADFKGSQGDAARQGRVDKARGALDKAIANCSGGGSGSSGYVGSGVVASGNAVLLSSESAAAVEVEAAAAEMLAELGEREAARAAARYAAKGATQIVTRAALAEAAATAAPVVASTGPSGWAIAGVAVAVVGVAVLGYIAYQYLATDEKATPPPATGGTTGGGSTPSSGGTGNTTKRPIPGTEEGSGCDRLKSFKKYCDNNGWQDLRCQDAARLLSSCGGDVREMFVGPDGVSGVGCPSAMSAEEIERLKCEAKGMVGRPEPGGSLCQTRGPMEAPTLDFSDVILTGRGDFREVFSGTSFKVVNSPGSLTDALSGSKQTTMVVFMDPDCPSCQNFSASLKSAEAQGALKSANVQVVVVDASLSTQLMAENNIRAFPTTMIMKNGAKTLTAIGSMNPKETAKFVNDVK